MLRRALLLCLAAGCSSFSSAPESATPDDGGAASDAGDASVPAVLPDGAPVPEAAKLAALGSLPLGLAASGSSVVVTQADGIRLFKNGQEVPQWETVPGVPGKELIGGPVIFSSDGQTVVFATLDHLRACGANVPKCDQPSSDLKVGGQSTALAATSARLLVAKSGTLTVCKASGTCDGPNGKASTLAGAGAPLALASNGSLVYVGENNQIETGVITADGSIPLFTIIATNGALSMAISQTEILWADKAGNLLACQLADPQCPAPRTVAATRAGAKDLTLFKGALYWLEPSGVVYRCDPNACTPQAIVSAPAATDLALGDKIYLVNASAIWSAPF